MLKGARRPVLHGRPRHWPRSCLTPASQVFIVDCKVSPECGFLFLVAISTAQLSPDFLFVQNMLNAHAVSHCQDEALHGCTQLLNFLGSFVLLGVLLSNLALLESSARPAVHLLRQRLQVLNLFSSLPSNHPTISLSGSSRSWISTGQTIQRGQLMHLAR